MSFTRNMVLGALVAFAGVVMVSSQAISQDKIDGTVAYFSTYAHRHFDAPGSLELKTWRPLKLDESIYGYLDKNLEKIFETAEPFELQKEADYFFSFGFAVTNASTTKMSPRFSGSLRLYDTYGNELIVVSSDKPQKKQNAVVKKLFRLMEKEIEANRAKIENNRNRRCLFCGYADLTEAQKATVAPLSSLAHVISGSRAVREKGRKRSPINPQVGYGALMEIHFALGNKSNVEHLLDNAPANFDSGTTLAGQETHLINEMIKEGWDGPVLDKMGALYAQNGFGQQEPTSKYTPLIRALTDKDLTTAKRLLEYGADPNQRVIRDGRSANAMDVVAFSGSTEAVELLLAFGGNKNEWPEGGGYSYNRAMTEGRYPQAFLLRPDVVGDPTSPENQKKLVQAALFSDAGSVQYYLNNGVPIGSTSFSGTPVFQAVLRGKQAFASSAGAEQQARERLGNARYDEIKQQIAVFQTSLNYWYSLEEIPEAEREGVEHLAKQTDALRREIGQRSETEQEARRRLGNDEYERLRSQHDRLNRTIEHYQKTGITGPLLENLQLELAGVSQQLGASLNQEGPGHRVSNDDAYLILNQLLDAGVNLDLQDAAGDTALVLALKNKQYAVAYTLINNGADLNIANSTGETPLSLALATRNEPMAVSLIEAGADFNNSKNSTPPVMMAYNMDMADAAAAMVARGADYSVTDADGLTLLHYASARGDMGLVNQLIEAGANVNALDYDDNSALYYAYPHPSKEFGSDNRRVIRALREAGADANHVNLVGYTAAENYRVGRETWQEEQRIRQIEDLTLRQELAAKQQQLAAQALEQERQRRVAAIQAERRRRAEAAKQKSGFNWGKALALTVGSVAGGGLNLDAESQANIAVGILADSMPGVQGANNTVGSIQQAGRAAQQRAAQQAAQARQSAEQQAAQQRAAQLAADRSRTQRQVTLRQAPDPALTHPDVRQQRPAPGQTAPTRTNTPPTPTPTGGEKDRERLPIHLPPERAKGPIYQIAWIGWAKNYETKFGYSNPDSAVDLLRTMIINDMHRLCRERYKGGILLPDTIQWIPLPKEHPDAIESRRWTASNSVGQVQCRYPDPRPRR